MTPALPAFYAISGPLEADGSGTPILLQDPGRAWLERFEQLLASHVTLVQLRVKQLDYVHLEQLIPVCQELATAGGAGLILNGPADLARRHGLAGVHLTSKALLDARKRPLSDAFLIGASCHSQAELRHAENLGCDFACLSPVKATKSYAPDEVLGLEQFAGWVRECTIPVYGLGGLGRDDLDDIRAAGGQGVAGISAFW